jgi:hypothetical protein
MKTNFSFPSVASFSFAVLFFMGVYTGANAQTQDYTVIAVSNDGLAHKAPSSLQVAVFPHIDPLKFQVALENSAHGNTTITLKDNEGHIVYRRLGIRTQKYVGNFDMSMLAAGSYTVEITNQVEKHRYHIQIGNRVVRDVEITPYKSRQKLLARLNK